MGYVTLDYYTVQGRRCKSLRADGPLLRADQLNSPILLIKNRFFYTYIYFVWIKVQEHSVLILKKSTVCSSLTHTGILGTAIQPS